MKVLDLRCSHGHAFEGYFASDDGFTSQHERGLIECPLCGDKAVTRLLSAPRLNLSGAREVMPVAAAESSHKPAPATTARSADVQAAWLSTVRQLMARTEDVGERFAEEARRIHYGEIPQRGIRGQATPAEREALQEEGIETMAIPVPRALQGPVQ